LPENTPIKRHLVYMPRLILILFLLLPNFLDAQVFPKEGDRLHYRFIGFLFPAGKGNCTLEIAKGDYHSESDFINNVLIKQTAKQNRIVAEVPLFGCAYTWRVVYRESGWESPLYHFSTKELPATENNTTRLTVTHQAETFTDAFLFADGNKTLYDLKGNAVWFLPDIFGERTVLRDLKATPQGTITFIAGQGSRENIYEINYNGDILWKGPDDGQVSGDTSEHYHHGFTRLANGHYMAMGSEFVAKKKDTAVVDALPVMPPAGNKMCFGTLIEYDEKGNVLWSWKSSSYFLQQDVLFSKSVAGMISDTHDNSFFFDERTNSIYVSFKNISQVIRVHYPDGRVTAVYGNSPAKNLQDATGSRSSEEFFCSQHSCIRSKKGFLYLYNNNLCHHNQPSSIIRLGEPATQKDHLQKLWEYSCVIDGNPNYLFPSGGNVEELPDESLLVNLGGRMWSKVFIVNERKKILWEAIPESFNSSTNEWNAFGQYKVSFVSSRHELNHLIWHEYPKDVNDKVAGKKEKTGVGTRIIAVTH
jgi:hypothetical protein